MRASRGNFLQQGQSLLRLPGAPEIIGCQPAQILVVRLLAGQADLLPVLFNVCWLVFDLWLLSVIVQAARYRGYDPDAAESLPEPAHAPSSNPQSATRNRKFLNILLVEDHTSTASTMARLLRTMGHQVDVAHGVRAALDLSAAKRFDLLISDIGLPDGTGHDLMRELRARHPIPGIALSGFGMEEDIKRSKAAGFAEHWTKPINVEQLKALAEFVDA